MTDSVWSVTVSCGPGWCILCLPVKVRYTGFTVLWPEPSLTWALMEGGRGECFIAQLKQQIGLENDWHKREQWSKSN